MYSYETTRLYPIIVLLFLILGYINSIKGNFASASVFVVTRIIFAIANYEKRGAKK